MNETNKKTQLAALLFDAYLCNTLEMLHGCHKHSHRYREFKKAFVAPLFETKMLEAKLLTLVSEQKGERRLISSRLNLFL